jgi:F-type H+-transporting ATPase subunit delta
MKHARVASRYAAALMGAAEESRAVDAVARDLDALRATLASSRELQRLLESPIVSPARKRAILKEIFGARFGPLTMEFLSLLVEKSRESALSAAIERWFAMRDERLGIVTVDVTTAVELSADQTRAITSALERTTGKTIRVRATTDAAIKAGLIVRIGDTVHDGSMRRQLERLRERLVTGSSGVN